MRARSVIAAIDDALILAQRVPVLFARMSRAGCSCRDLSFAYDLHMAGFPTRYIAFLDNPGTARRAKVNRRRNKVAKQARKVNR